MHVPHWQFLLQTGGSVGASETLSTSPPPEATLLAIDQILAGLAGLVLVGVLVVQLRRPERLRLIGAPPRPNRVHEDALALAVAVYLMAVLVLSFAMDAARLDPGHAAAALIVGSGSQLVGLIACVVLASRRFDGGVSAFLLGRPDARPRRTWRLTLTIALIAIGLCPVIAYLALQLVLVIDPAFTPPEHPTLSALQEEPSWLLSAALWLGAAVIAPLAEECFFRGLLQTMLVGLTENRWVSILLVSLAFGLVHYPQPHAVVALVFLSILIGYAYERTGSLAAPVMIHALFNLKTLVWEAIARSGA